MIYKSIVKNIIDLLIALVALFILSPILIITLISLLFANQGKIFFIQERPGKNGKIFKIIKFKTMNDSRDRFGNLLPDVERLTSIGKLVRKLSIDEVPQLFNVIKGEMSLVGPRPLLPKYLSRYNSFQMRRQEVKPGITGWAQINGRNAMSWSQKFEFDVWYVDNISFLLDLKILYNTVAKVLQAEGISSENSATMEEFKGECFD
jgi:lipopolysaccharide/colanic/teichoic acid biosynthesis glycosyltransferase